MKKLILKLVFFGFLGFVYSYTVSLSLLAAIEDKEELQLKIIFSCCQKAKLEEQLLKIEGIERVSADITTKIVTITFDNKITSAEKIKSSIERLGYQIDAEGTQRSCKHHGEKKEIMQEGERVGRPYKGGHKCKSHYSPQTTDTLRKKEHHKDEGSHKCKHHHHHH